MTGRARRQQRKRMRTHAERTITPTMVFRGPPMRPGVNPPVRVASVRIKGATAEVALEPVGPLPVDPRTPSERLRSAVSAFPGRTSGVLAKLTGTTVGTASTTLRRMFERGEIRRVETDGNKFAYYPPV